MEDFPPMLYGKSLIYKSFVLAIEIVNLDKYLVEEKKELKTTKKSLKIIDN